MCEKYGLVLYNKVEIEPRPSKVTVTCEEIVRDVRQRGDRCVADSRDDCRALVRGMTRLEFILDPDGLQLENAASRVHLYRIWV